MRKILATIKFSLFFILLFLVTTSTNAQLRDYGVKVGAQFNYVLQANEFFNRGEQGFSYLGRVFLRTELSEGLGIELGGGYGKLNGKDYTLAEYNTTIIPIDARLLFPLGSKTFNPYFFVGGGMLNYTVDDRPVSVSPEPVEDSGWAPYALAGAGFEILLSNSAMLDISVGYNYSFTDNLNYYKVDEFTDGYINVGLGLALISGSSSADPDGDGLTNKEENEIGTDPDIADTDGDGLDDGDEFNTHNTDPLNADTDGDGLNDGDEVLTNSTDPLNADTDSDGLTDGDEVLTNNTDPLSADTDEDGLSDGDEINNYRTSPNNADTDIDGLNDGEEIMEHRTDPLNADTEGDGLLDGAEVNEYKTNPFEADTDGGTIDDYTEVNRGTNPLDAEDDVIEVGVAIILDGVTFANNSDEISQVANTILRDGALVTMTTYTDINVEVRGYTDNTGTAAYNLVLSKRRAESVMNWLIDNGVDSSRMTALGFGQQNPIASNNTRQGRAQNRRIEFVIVE